MGSMNSNNASPSPGKPVGWQVRETGRVVNMPVRPTYKPTNAPVYTVGWVDGATPFVSTDREVSIALYESREDAVSVTVKYPFQEPIVVWEKGNEYVRVMNPLLKEMLG